MCKNKLHVCTYSTVLRFVNLFVEVSQAAKEPKPQIKQKMDDKTQHKSASSTETIVWLWLLLFIHLHKWESLWYWSFCYRMSIFLTHYFCVWAGYLMIWKKRRTKVFNWSEVHFYQSNFLQNPYFSIAQAK